MGVCRRRPRQPPCGRSAVPLRVTRGLRGGAPLPRPPARRPPPAATSHLFLCARAGPSPLGRPSRAAAWRASSRACGCDRTRPGGEGGGVPRGSGLWARAVLPAGRRAPRGAALDRSRRQERGGRRARALPARATHSARSLPETGAAAHALGPPPQWSTCHGRPAGKGPAAGGANPAAGRPAPRTARARQRQGLWWGGLPPTHLWQRAATAGGETRP